MATPKDPEHQHALVVERALKPDGGEIYTLDFCASHAAVLVAAAAMAGLDPGSWILRVLGERIADEAARATPQQPAPPATVN